MTGFIIFPLIMITSTFSVQSWTIPHLKVLFSCYSSFIKRRVWFTMVPFDCNNLIIESWLFWIMGSHFYGFGNLKVLDSSLFLFIQRHVWFTMVLLSLVCKNLWYINYLLFKSWLFWIMGSPFYGFGHC